MTAVPPRAPTHLQPRLKALATTQPPITVTNPPTPKPSTPTSSRASSRQLSSDALSDKTTIALVRRVLCSPSADKTTPLSEILPPLTSSNDVDLQLYAIIAIIIKEFVYTWYGKITPDQTFVEEVVRIIAHCTRGVEQRLRKVDLESLVFDELPELLDTHITAYRASHQALHPPPLETDAQTIYHSLWPHPALSPVPKGNDPESVQLQQENESAYRQILVEGVLAVLLPPEDLENDALTALVGQIFSEMIIGNGIGGKASEPWLLWEGITKICEAIQNQLPKAKAQVRAEKSTTQLAGSSLEFEDSQSSAIRTKKRWFSFSIQKTLWLVPQYAILIFIAIRFVIVTIATSSSLPSRTPPFVKVKGETPVKERLQAPTDLKSDPRIIQPILDMKIWRCLSNLLDLDMRMPWLCATLSMLQWGALRGPGEIGNVDGMIDKILTTHLLQPLLRVHLPHHLPTLLRLTRSALFPNNAPGPARIPPSSPQEIADIKRNAAKAMLGLIPGGVRGVYFGTSASSRSRASHAARRVDEAEDSNVVNGTARGEARGEKAEEQEQEEQLRVQILDLLGDKYANKHLLYGILELVVVRLVPELASGGVLEVLGERLG